MNGTHPEDLEIHYPVHLQEVRGKDGGKLWVPSGGKFSW
jgi:hypothetical protein